MKANEVVILLIGKYFKKILKVYYLIKYDTE